MSPSSISLRSQMLRETTASPSFSGFAPKPSAQPLSSKAVVRFSGVRATPDNGYTTPVSRGRSAIYRMSRSPYFRPQPTITTKVLHARTYFGLYVEYVFNLLFMFSASSTIFHLEFLLLSRMTNRLKMIILALPCQLNGHPRALHFPVANRYSLTIPHDGLKIFFVNATVVFLQKVHCMKERIVGPWVP